MNNQLLRVIVLTLCCAGLISTDAPGQDYLYETKHYLIDPTLSDNQVNAMVQDKHGLLWVSTKRGIARFNGYQFDVFEGGGKNLNLPTGNVSALEILGDTMYIASEKGLLLLHTSSLLLTQLKDDPSAGYEVNDMAQSPSGTLYWCSSDGYLNKRSRSGIARYRLPYVYKPANLALKINGANIYVFDLYQGMICVDTNTLQLKQTYTFPTEVKDNKMVIDHRGRLLCLTGDHVYAIDPRQGRLLSYDSLGSKVNDLLYVDSGNFTIRNSREIWHHYNVNGVSQQKEIRTDIDAPFRIYKLYNVSGQLVATSTEGLIILQYKSKKFAPIYTTYRANSTISDVPRGIVEDQENYYFGTYYTLGVYNKQKQTIVNTVTEPLSIHWMVKEMDTIWMATEGNGLIKYLSGSKKVIRLQPRYEGKQVYLKSMAKWDNNIFLLGGYQYLFVYDRRSGVFSKPEIRYKDLFVSDLEINHIIPIDERQFLMATNKGIFRINNKWMVIQHYRAGKDSLDSNLDYVNALLLMPNGKIWSGTSNGIVCFDATGKKIHHFTKSEGLAGNKIASIVADKQQRLWVSTFTGLSLLDTDSNEITNYFMEDGLPDNEFNRSAYLPANNGDILLGTVMGYIRFSPAQFRFPSGEAGKISISKIVYGSEDGEQTFFNPGIAGSKSIRLGKNIGYIKIHFYTDPVEVHKNPLYEYKIEGIHGDWVSMGNIPILHLDNIKTGKYTLKVRMISGYGSKGILQASFPLVVQQYFYTAPWFYLLMLLTVLLLVIGYIRLLLAREKRMREVRRDISQDLHDEIGSYLTGISMNMDLMQKNKEKEQQYKQTIRHLGTKSLQALKDGLWSLDPGSDTAEQLWDRIKSIAKETLDPLDIGYTFTDPPGLQQIRLTMLEKRNLVFIIKECITNSIKYGDGQLVHFTWQIRKGCHEISIQNTIGPTKKAQEGGQGLVHIKNRMQRIQGEASFAADNLEFTVTLQLLFIHDTTRHYRG